MDKRLESVTEATTSQIINRPKPNANSEVVAVSHNYRCSKRMTELLDAFEQVWNKEVLQSKFQDVTTNSKLVQRLLDIKRLRAARKTALIIHLELFGSDESLTKSIQGVLSEVGKLALDYEKFEITGTFPKSLELKSSAFGDQTSGLKTKSADEVLKTILAWVTAQESVRPQPDISIEYLLITDARVQDLDKEQTQILLKKFTSSLKNYLRAAVYTTQVEEEARALMTSILELDVDTTENPGEVLRQYVDEKRFLYTSIKEAQKISDELLYSELIMQHAANVDALAKTTEQILSTIKDRAYRDVTKIIYGLYTKELTSRLAFLEFEEQDFLNRLTRQKLAVQEVVVAACEDKVKNTESRIHLKKVVMQMKIEGAEIRKEVDKIKSLTFSQREESNYIIKLP